MGEQDHFGTTKPLRRCGGFQRSNYIGQQSSPVGRAQGLYIYDRKDYFTAWLGFSFWFNSTDHKGTLSFIGADPLNKTRDISVVGGTGDFFMPRGIATLMTDAYEGDVYFRLRVDVKLYQCW